MSSKTDKFIENIRLLKSDNLFHIVSTNKEFIEMLIYFNTNPNEFLGAYIKLYPNIKEEILVGLSWLLPLSKNLFIFLLSKTDDASSLQKTFLDSNLNYLAITEQYLKHFSKEFEEIESKTELLIEERVKITDEKLEIVNKLQEEKLQLQQEQNSILLYQQELTSIKEEFKTLKQKKETLPKELEIEKRELSKLKIEFNKLDQKFNGDKESILEEIKQLKERIKILKVDSKYNEASSKLEKTVKPLIKKAEEELASLQIPDLIDEVDENAKNSS